MYTQVYRIQAGKSSTTFFIPKFKRKVMNGNVKADV